jgi:hypothetical protein
MLRDNAFAEEMSALCFRVRDWSRSCRSSFVRNDHWVRTCAYSAQYRKNSFRRNYRDDAFITRYHRSASLYIMISTVCEFPLRYHNRLLRPYRYAKRIAAEKGCEARLYSSGFQFIPGAFQYCGLPVGHSTFVLKVPRTHRRCRLSF